MNIRTKLILALLLVAGVPFALAALFSYALFIGAAEDVSNARARHSLDLIEQEFVKRQRDAVGELRTFTAMLPVKRSIMLKRPMDLRHQLVPLREGFRYDRMAAWDADCTLLMRAEAPGDFGRRLASDPMVERTALGSDAAGLVQRKDGLYLEAATPVVVEGAVYGGLLAGFRLDTAFLQHIGGLLSIDICIRETSCGRVVTTLPALNSDIGFQARTSAVPTGQANAEETNQAAVERNSPACEAHREMLDGQPYIVVSRPLQDIKGREVAVLTAALSLTHIRAESSRSVRLLFGVLSVCLLVALLLGFWVSGRFVSSVRLFREAAIRMAGGRLDERLSVSSQDEVRELADSFNRMAGNLKTLFDLSRESAFAANIETLTEVNIRAAVNALGAKRGSLMLYDAKKDQLAISKVIGFEGMVTERVAFKPGEGIAGLAFSTKTTVISNELPSESQIVAPQLLGEGDEKPVLIATPLISEEEAIGVLTIVHSHGAHLDSADRHLLETIATQVAAAIARAKLFELAITDGLTGLFIHRYFQARLQDEIQRGQRHKTPVCLLMADIDHFKKINDTFGHQQGDKVLREVADIIKGCVRSIDLPARYGGEEFTVILSNTALDAAATLAERIRKRIEEHDFPGMGSPGKVTISIGVSEFPCHAKDSQRLIACADKALYASKGGGRNRVTIAGR